MRNRNEKRLTASCSAWKILTESTIIRTPANFPLLCNDSTWFNTPPQLDLSALATNGRSQRHGLFRRHGLFSFHASFHINLFISGRTFKWYLSRIQDVNRYFNTFSWQKLRMLFRQLFGRFPVYWADSGLWLLVRVLIIASSRCDSPICGITLLPQPTEGIRSGLQWTRIFKDTDSLTTKTIRPRQ